MKTTKDMKKIIYIALICLMGVLNSCTCYSKNYHASNAAKNLIKQHESCQLKAYWDSNGYSIGWGHHKSDVKKNQVISKAVAERYFRDDVAIAEQSVNSLLSDLPYEYRFSQGFIDGLTSLVYNCGEGGIRSSKFYKVLKNCRVRNGKINKNDLAYAISFVKNTRISAAGHIERRKEEMKLMLA